MGALMLTGLGIGSVVDRAFQRLPVFAVLSDRVGRHTWNMNGKIVGPKVRNAVYLWMISACIKIVNSKLGRVENLFGL